MSYQFGKLSVILNYWNSVMTHLNKLQAVKIICPNCGQKHLKTIGWLSEHQSIDCNCGVETTHNQIESLVNQAMTELK